MSFCLQKLHFGECEDFLFIMYEKLFCSVTQTLTAKSLSDLFWNCPQKFLSCSRKFIFMLLVYLASIFKFFFFYMDFFLGYNYMAVTWQRNLATTTSNLEIYNNNSNKKKKLYNTEHTYI